MKPTKAELLQQTSRGGRVFLFEYPDSEDRPGYCHMPTYQAQERIEEALLNLPGCKEISGPHINGIYAITIDDSEENAGSLSDDQIRERIAAIFHRYWRE